MSLMPLKGSNINDLFAFIWEVCRGNVLDAFRGRAAVLSWQSQRSAALQGIKENNKKTDLQTQQRNDYTSLCLLWHFSKLIIHHAFLPLLPWGGSWDCFTRKVEKEKHSAVSSSHHISSPALFCLFLSTLRPSCLSLYLPVKLFYTTEIEDGEEWEGDGLFS